MSIMKHIALVLVALVGLCGVAFAVPAAQGPVGMAPAANNAISVSAWSNIAKGLPVNQRAPTVTDDSSAGFLDPTQISWISPIGPGTGVTTASVSIAAPPAGGVQATATAVIVGGSIPRYIITNPGRGYTSVPAVTVTNNGSAVAAQAALSQGDLWVQTSPVKQVFQLQDSTPGAAAWLPYYGVVANPCDAGPTALGAYASFLLFSAYTTNKDLDVTRVSDGTTLTIGFKGTDVDSASADAFCAGTTCRVTKWYDQSGGTADISNAVANAAYWTGNTFNGHRIVTLPSQPSNVAAVSLAIVSGGTGYVTGDQGKVVTLAGGSGSAATGTITTVAGGAVTGITLTSKGGYTTVPSNPVSVTGSTTGTGLTLTVTYTTFYLTGTTASYTDGSATAIAAVAPRTAQMSNALGQLNSRVMYLSSVSANYPSAGLASSSFGFPISTAPDLVVFQGTGSAVSVTNGNRIVTQAFGAGTTGTSITLGTSALTGTAQYDTAAFILYGGTVTPAQMIALRASLSSRLDISPQAQTQYTWIAEGDSITNGYNNAPSLVRNYPGQALRQIVRPVQQFNIGIYGITLASQLANDALHYSTLYNPSARVNIFTTDLGTNDISANATAAAMEANLQALVAYQKSLGANVKSIVMTITPVNGRTGSQLTNANAYNAWIQANWNIPQSLGGLGADALCDFASDPVMGLQANTASTTYYQDGEHPSDFGYGFLAKDTAACVNPFLQ